jgi:hypothetical protein
MASALFTFIGLAGSLFVFGFGAFLVFRGASAYLAMQKMAGTPTSRARSVALGLVELRGEAAPAEGLVSHLSRTPCIFSRLEVEKFNKAKGAWVQVGAEERASGFFLSDKSGKIFIDSAKAEYDFGFQSRTIEVFLKQDGRAAASRAEIAQAMAATQSQFSLGPIQDMVMGGKETGYGEVITTSRIIASMSPVPRDSKAVPPGVLAASMLNDYLASDLGAAGAFRRIGAGELRLTEKFIPSGSEIYVLGSAEQRAGGGVPAASGGNVVRRGRDGILVVSDKSEKTLTRSKVARAAILTVLGLGGIILSIVIAVQFA